MQNDGQLHAGQRFPRREHIRSRRDISLVFEKGARHSVKGLRMHLLPCGSVPSRVVFVTIRNYGNAVQRNRARRVVSESWRLLKSGLSTGLDVVVVIYPSEDTLAARQQQMSQLLRRFGIIQQQ